MSLGSCSRTEMNEVFQRVREQVEIAGIERCLYPTGKTRGFVFFFPQLSLLSWMLRVEEKGLSDPQLAVNRLVHCPNQLQATMRTTTCPSPHPSVRTAEERVAEINRSLDFASEYISSYFIQTRCIPQSFLRQAFMHLLKEKDIIKRV